MVEILYLLFLFLIYKKKSYNPIKKKQKKPVTPNSNTTEN